MRIQFREGIERRTRRGLRQRLLEHAAQLRLHSPSCPRRLFQPLGHAQSTLQVQTSAKSCRARRSAGRTRGNRASRRYDRDGIAASGHPRLGEEQGERADSGRAPGPVGLAESSANARAFQNRRPGGPVQTSATRVRPSASRSGIGESASDPATELRRSTAPPDPHSRLRPSSCRYRLTPNHVHPGEFAPMLATSEPVLLVGGQAVNLWALYYKKRTTHLAPFVSRDIDVLGDRSTLEALGKAAGAKPQFFPVKPLTNEVGVVVAKDSNGLPLLIEVLRHVHGVSNEELRDPVYTVAVGEIQVRLPSPIALLQAKTANVADISQAGRQDARHVAILAQLLPAYLEELQTAAVEGRLEERKLIGFLERLLGVVTAPKAKAVLRQLQLAPRTLFSGLGHDKLLKLQTFIDKRLPRQV